MKVLTRAVLRGWVTALVALVAAFGLAAPGFAASAPPRFDDGFGRAVVSQPVWADTAERTFTFTVKSDQVPACTALPGQISGEHVVMDHFVPLIMARLQHA
jgi:hypothetical protein